MINFNETTAVLITKNETYPIQVLESVAKYPFKGIMIRTNCKTVHARYDLAMMSSSSTPFIYVQDDDALGSIGQLMREADPTRISCVMKPHYFYEYEDLKCCLIGWGAVIPYNMIVDGWESLYQNKFGFDSIMIMEADRIFTAFHYPQLRIPSSGIQDLPWAMLSDRLSMAPDHYEKRRIALRRVAEIEKERKNARSDPKS